ncbi:MAG TPA: hypothetical protein VHP57_06510, partial [Acidimicrobiia bacterium]|nr:hypothetical protein [Acidimicrobiia bacterium]
LEEPGRFTIGAVTRLGTARIFDSALVGQEGDILHFMVDNSAVTALDDRLAGPVPTTGGH